MTTKPPMIFVNGFAPPPSVAETWEPEELIQRAVEAEREACALAASIALLGADKSLADRVVNAIRTRKALS